MKHVWEAAAGRGWWLWVALRSRMPPPLSSSLWRCVGGEGGIYRRSTIHTHTHRLTHSHQTRTTLLHLHTHAPSIAPPEPHTRTHIHTYYQSDGLYVYIIAEDKISPCQKIQIVYLLVCHNPGVHRCVLCCTYPLVVVAVLSLLCISIRKT